MIRKLLHVVFFGWAVLQITYSPAQTTVGMGLSTRRALATDWLGYNGMCTIREGACWADPTLIGKIPELHPKVLRYPAGGIANWWDWKRGWFMDVPYLPSNYVDLPRQSDYLEDFKVVMDSCHANAVFDLNLVTSTLQDQIAMLRHADSIGIPVKYVELGNEFYLDGSDPEAGEGILFVDSVYPTARSYGIVANIWVDSIHLYFPDAIVAIQGCFVKNGQLKRKTWNDSLLAVSNHREDAWTFHTYYCAGWNDTTQSEAQLAVQKAEEIPDWLYQPFKAWSVLASSSLPAVPEGKEIWITEYNMTDHDRPVHGTWGHGLFLGTLSLQFLNDSRIHFFTCHNMDGSGVHGQYFYGTTGFTFGDELGTWVRPAGAPNTTTLWGLTAGGNVMKTLGEAVDQKEWASPLVFVPNPQVMTVEDYGLDTFYYDGIYGWLFNNSTGSDAFILNLTSTSYELTTNVLFPTGGAYVLKYASVLKAIGKNADLTTVNNAPLPPTLTLPPYSVLKITSSMVPLSPPVETIHASGSLTLCAGDSVQLDAGSGFIYYQWSTGSNKRKIWVKESGDYWVHAYTTANGYAGGDTVHVTVNPVPTSPNIIPQGNRTFCEGGSAVLDPQGNFNANISFLWNTGAATEAILVTAGGDYSVTITDQNGCTAVSDTETITVHPLPHPVITASGPTSFCYNENVILSAPAGYNTYHWSNGLYGKSKTVSDAGTYSVTVTDVYKCVGQSANSIEVNVWDPPTPTITVTGPSSFCADGSTPCTLKTIEGYNYIWKRNGNEISGATKKSYKPDEGGNYKVLITDSNGCTRISGTSAITLLKLPSTIISVTGGKNYCIGKVIILSTKLMTGYNYQWKLNGVDILGATFLTYLVTSSGDYSYSATDLNGCSKTSPVISITGNCKTEAGESPEGPHVSELSLYPNPALNSIHISALFESGNDGAAVLEIENVLGEVVYSSEENIVSGKCEANVTFDQHFSGGAYFVRLQSGKETLIQQFVIAGSAK